MRRAVVTVFSVITLVGVAVFAWTQFAPPAQVAELLLSIERARAGLERKELTVSGSRIVYLEGGSGEVLLLLHGIGADKDNWTRVAPYLTEQFRVIALDLPGFGESDRPTDRSYASKAQAEQLHEIAAMLGLSTFHLGGNSMGGLISARYAVAYPEQVKTLWLLAPGGVGAGPSGILADLGPDDHVPLFARSFAEFENLIGIALERPPYVPGAVKRALAVRAAADYDLHVGIYREINSEWIAEPLEKTVAGLRTPTRIVWGEKDRLLPVGDAEILRTAMPGASVLRLANVGHMPMLEVPQTVGTDYVAFVTALRSAPLPAN